MCKVVRHYFVCSHQTRVRKSKCRGQFRKVRLDNTTVGAWCSREPYIDISFPFSCGPCQQLEWEAKWKQRLKRAETFLAKLGREGPPGIIEISDLVKALEDEYHVAAWDIRSLFPPVPKDLRMPKVEMGDNEKKRSRLAQEVRPEDVVLSHEEESEWDEETANDHGEPMTYDNPIYALESSSWIDDYYPQEASEEAEFAASFEPDGWGASTWGSDMGVSAGVKASVEVAQIPNAETESYSWRTEQIIKEFWSIVDPDVETQTQQSRQHPKPQYRDRMHETPMQQSPTQQPQSLSRAAEDALQVEFKSLDISDSAFTPVNTEPHHPWTDGGSDTHLFTSAQANDIGHVGGVSLPSPKATSIQAASSTEGLHEGTACGEGGNGRRPGTDLRMSIHDETNRGVAQTIPAVPLRPGTDRRMSPHGETNRGAGQAGEPKAAQLHGFSI